MTSIYLRGRQWVELQVRAAIATCGIAREYNSFAIAWMMTVAGSLEEPRT